MTLRIYRLRRLLGVTAILLTMVVAGMYFYARFRAINVLRSIPGKLGYEIKQTANGFQFSKSDGKRTLFTIEASDLKEFKLNGRAELHNVSIVLYGRDSSRFDQIYGNDFAYDPKSGDVTAKGDVQIDLVANPAGLTGADQAAPKELKNPIHLMTRDLVFNRETGNATTDAQVEFRTPQASGTAVGVKYVGKSNTLTLGSQIHVVLAGANAAVIDAVHGIITNEPRQVVLDQPHLVRKGGITDAEQAVFYLGPDNNVERVLAMGNVRTVTRASRQTSLRQTLTTQTSPTQTSPTQTSIAQTSMAQTSTAQKTNRRALTSPSAGDSAVVPAEAVISGRADQGEFLLTESRDLLRLATLTGHVHFEQTGAQPMQGEAGRVIMEFAGQNQLQKVHAVDGARLSQRAAKGNKPTEKGMAAGPQDFEITAPIIDFTVADGHILQHAVTSGAAQITISQAQIPEAREANRLAAPSGQRTVVTAGKFNAEFATFQGKDHLASIHGAPNTRIVSSTLGQPDRVSTSDSIDAVFLPQGGVDFLTQKGNFVYSDGQPAEKRMQAFANAARYTPVDQMLLLSGSPRVTDGAMATTAKTIRINRATGEALAEDDVKTTYSQVKEQPNGALLASSSPIHVTSQSMTAQNAGGLALYSGNARLWQDANIIEAPTIQFDRDRRFVTAQGTAADPVQTILVQTEKAQTEKAQTGPAQAGKIQNAETPNPPAQQATAGKTPASGGGQENGTRGKEIGKRGGVASRLGGSNPIAITASKLTYADSERRVHYEAGVVAKSADFTASAKTLDAYLLPRSQTSANQSLAHPGQLDRMVAQGDVVIVQPKRRAEGQKLVYTAADDKFVLTGGPPSIFDAEQGKITGVSLTFFRGDDRVLVEGEVTPGVTQTRVAK
jgi:lipopolysaccharide export system protein LptA